MTMNLSVYNESDPLWRAFPDVYTPRLQLFKRQEPCGMEYIDNIDVVTTWKGLSSSEIAKELLFWENALQNAICSTVEAWLVEKLKSTGIVLNFDGKSTLPHWELDYVLSYISKWSDRTVPCKLQRLVDEMLLEYECSNQVLPWLVHLGAEDVHIALENYICTHTCFRHTTSTRCMLVSFASQAVNEHLQVFATVKSRPHYLRMDHSLSPPGITFDQAIPDSLTPLYHTDLQVTPDFYQNVYHCSVRTYFPGGVIFERLFRFIAYLSAAGETPEYIPDWLIEARRTAQELKEDLHRVHGLPIKLREVSINSTRVQDAANEPEPPTTFEDNLFVGKSINEANTDVFDEIAGHKQGHSSTIDLQTSILDEYLVGSVRDEEHDDEDMSFVGPDSPEIIICQMEELQEQFGRLELQLKASLHSTTSGSRRTSSGASCSTK
ncbi:hypothetical protein BLS_002765 [Venturia inaequalis]|uniref:Uncharacterized protein n=1 Tax=Venturia inaequalis TaxID=5025 RepID=A0A8H3URT0_VENIN|nr:hypothetical protein BLS_002765 [Venturia inaequalis]KAE9975526.1 hypothetical protein EG327_008426 [Venturia inaequalis]KAE9982711.1 hypothetical protein EG328_010704 [Venturia inaequalis]RDI84243.1 hypothetical protein Vi05172_g5666 [Venturia inaequalis]